MPDLIVVLVRFVILDSVVNSLYHTIYNFFYSFIKKLKLEEWNEKTFHGSTDRRIYRYRGCRIG